MIVWTLNCHEMHRSPTTMGRASLTQAQQTWFCHLLHLCRLEIHWYAQRQELSLCVHKYFMKWRLQKNLKTLTVSEKKPQGSSGMAGFLTSGDGEAAASTCGSHKAGYLPWLAVSKSVLWGKGSEFPGGDYRQSLSW